MKSISIILCLLVCVLACGDDDLSVADGGATDAPVDREDGILADSGPTDIGRSGDSQVDAFSPDAGASSASRVTLPTGVQLDLPAIPRADDFDCADPDVHCVPSEFDSPQAAADIVVAGDTVRVAAGRYPGFTIRTSGTSEEPILFIGETGAILDDFSGTDHGVVFRSDFDNDFYVDSIQLVGFTIDSPPGRCVHLTKAIASRPTTGHLIANNICRNSGREGFVLSQMSLSWVEGNLITNSGRDSSIDDLDHGIYLSNGGTGNSVIRHNVILGASTNGIHVNGDRHVDTGGTDGIISGLLFDGNIIAGNGQNGINLDGAQQVHFINNVFYQNGRHAIRGYAIDGAAGPEAMVVINNTIIEHSSGVKFSDSLGGHVVFNNLFVDMRDTPVAVPEADLTAAANLTLDGASFASLPANTETPSEAEVRTFDFRATTTSRASLVDAGQPSLGGRNAPAHDLSGATRVANPDIGAFEY